MSQATVQQELSHFQTTTPTVQTTHDGVVIPPDEVENYRLVEGPTDIVYAAPLLINTNTVGATTVEQQYHFVCVTERSTDDHVVLLQAGVEYDNPILDRDYVGVVAEAETKSDAVEDAISWIQQTPSPTVATLNRPGDMDAADRHTASGEPMRQPMKYRQIDKQADRIRVGSTVHIDALPPATVVEKTGVLEVTDTQWMCELPDGDTVILAVENTVKPNAYYRVPTAADYEQPYITAEHLTVSNTDNLRDNVDQDTYEWLQSKQGETVIRQTGDHTFEVIEIDDYRDGMINPHSNGAIDPTTRRSEIKDTYINGDSEWFDNSVDLPVGSYMVRQNGVVETDDTYATDPLVSANEWDDNTPFAPTAEATEVETTIENARATDRSQLSRDDDVTEIIGVGASVKEEMWHETVGELYDDGWPAAYIGNQYAAKAIAELFTAIGDIPTAGDAARAVVGQLGGIGYNDDGEQLGTVASMIAGSINGDELTYGWLGHKRIKDELTPDWIEADDNPTDIYTGPISAEDIRETLAAEYDADLNTAPSADEIEAHSVTKFHRGVMDGKGVALAVDGETLPLPERCIKTIATVADVDLTALSDDTHNITVYPGYGGSLILFNNTRRPYNVVVDIDDAVDHDDLLGVGSDVSSA